MSAAAALTGPDGRVRCWWPGDDDGYIAYHDQEWGRPVTDDDRLFEKLCLMRPEAGEGARLQGRLIGGDPRWVVLTARGPSRFAAFSK